MTTETTPLLAEIKQRILENGPITIAEFMSVCLLHPIHGYYTSHTPIGGHDTADTKGGDFITAPEISQIFGELIAIWCMEVWQALGSPGDINLVELGPGRGTLMNDILRTARSLPDFDQAINVTLIEASPTLTEQQRNTLAGSCKNITWATSIDRIEDRPTILVANEFLDALPFHQWTYQNGKWMERGVALVDNQLAFVTLPNALPSLVRSFGSAHAAEGEIFETSPAREAVVSALATRIKRQGGAALFIDYGHLESGPGDTFQAMMKHAFVDPLQEPGRADLTSHVDFEPLAKAARSAGCEVPEPTDQGSFLLSLGLLERAGALGRGKDEHIRHDLQRAVERLAAPNQMGSLFKVMAFGTAKNPTDRWPGFG